MNAVMIYDFSARWGGLQSGWGGADGEGRVAGSTREEASKHVLSRPSPLAPRDQFFIPNCVSATRYSFACASYVMRYALG